MSCVCGSGASVESCCGPYVEGKALPPTAEALMRSRYAAYVLGAVDYILETTAVEAREGVDRANTELWSKSAEWLGLEIVRTEGGGPSDEQGTVEFIARFKVKGFPQRHHEIGEFVRRDGRWFFADGEEVPEAPAVRSEPRIGRNDPCRCGSGKKYKKCCGKAA